MGPGKIKRVDLCCSHWVALLLACLWPVAAAADAIMVSRAMSASTIGEFYIGESSLRVELEIGLADLPTFRNLLPDEIYAKLELGEAPLRTRLQTFFAEDLVIRTGEGERLPGRLLHFEARPRVERDEITGEPKPVADEAGELVLFAVLEYAFTGRPESLEFRAPSPGGTVAANIGFVVYHLGLPVNDFRYLAGPVVLDLDWRDPWYSKFRIRNLRRQYDAPLNVFLYAEPYEVRVEVIARPHDLQQWIDLGVAGRAPITVAQQPEVKERVAAFLAEHFTLTIDGEPVTPALDRVHFLSRTLRSSRVIDPPEDLDPYAATLGVIFVAQTPGLPQEAALTWDLFSERIQRIPAAATDEAGPLRFYLDPDDPVLRWQNFLKNPTLPTLATVAPPPGPAARLLASATPWLAALFVASAAILLVGRVRGRSPQRVGLVACGLLALLLVVSFAGARRVAVGQEEASEILGAVLTNVYRAFDFRDESAIYDALERSVAGDLLVELYLETRRSLELASQGGARAKVKEVELLEVVVDDSEGREGFVAQGTWNVSGAVGHWGHIHTRRNQYRANLTLEPIDDHWKITALEILQEERL
jgi:hypothetical protein